MSEYWRSEDDTSFCFCSDGEWYQAKKRDPSGSQWHFCAVTTDRGLPVDMHENSYREVDLAAMLGTLQWTEEELASRVASQLSRVNDARVD